MPAVIEDQRTQERRATATEGVQNTVEQRVKEQLSKVEPELTKTIQNAAQAFSSAASGSGIVSFSAAQKTGLVNGAVDAVVEQLGADLAPAHKAALKSNLSDTIKYALRAELEKVQSNAAEQGRLAATEIEPNKKGISKATSNGIGLSTANRALFGEQVGFEQPTANQAGRSFGFGSRQSSNIAQTSVLPTAQPLAAAIAQPTTSNRIAEGQPQKIGEAVPQALSVREIQAAITTASVNVAKEIAAVRAALMPLNKEPSAFEGAVSKLLNTSNTGTLQKRSSVNENAFAFGHLQTQAGSFQSFLKTKLN